MAGANELRVRVSGGSIKMAGTLRGAWLPGLLPARKNSGRRWTNVFCSVGQKKLLQVRMDGQPLQALSNAPRGWACQVIFFFWVGQRTLPGWHYVPVAPRRRQRWQGVCLVVHLDLTAFGRSFL